MKISFIIGSFNRPGRMRTCLASLVDQTFTDWEALIVDNSTDEEARELQQKYMKQFNDPRLRYEYIGDRALDPRIGIRSLYTASEIGVGMTTGEWLAFPNDDSYMCPWYAERMMQKAEKDNLEFVYCDIVNGRHDIPHYPLKTAPVSCGIDKTCFMLKREWMPQEWPGKVTRYGIADGDLVVELVMNGIRHGKVPMCLVVHN